MKKTLIVRTRDNKSSHTLSGSEEKITAFIKWVKNYKRGKLESPDVVICKSDTDIFVCKQKAIREGLISSVSCDEIKSKKLSSM